MTDAHHHCECSQETCHCAPIMVLFVSHGDEQIHFHGCAEHEPELVAWGDSVKARMPDMSVIVTRSN